MKMQENIKLSEVLWYKIGGVARYLFECSTRKDVLDAILYLKENKIKNIFICGYGTNLVFSDDYFDGAVIKLSEDYTKPASISFDGNRTISAFAGTALDSVITYALNHQLNGLEWAGGLPGTIGAGIRGNVGAYGGEIRESLLNAEILTLEDNFSYSIKTYTNEELLFSYRHSLVKDNPSKMIVLSASFLLKPATKDETETAKLTYQKRIQQRKERHPLEYPNCGSVFKNINEPEKIEKILKVYPELNEKIVNNWYGKISSAYLIQKLGLQGYRVGDAQVSTKHALFIVNLNKASAADVRGVINAIQIRFKEVFGFELTPEVEIVS